MGQKEISDHSQQLIEKLEYAESELTHYKGLNKELKLELATSEKEALKQKTRADQLQVVLSMLASKPQVEQNLTTEPISGGSELPITKVNMVKADQTTKSTPKLIEMENLADELAENDFNFQEKNTKEEELIDIQALPSFMSARGEGFDMQPYSHFSVLSQENERVEEFD